MSGVSRVSINKLLLKIRCRLAHLCEQASPFCGEIEVHESYFVPHRVRGKRGRGASGKTIVFGLLKRQNNVYTEIVPDASKAQLQQIIRGKVGIDSVIHSDGWRGYNCRKVEANNPYLREMIIPLSSSGYVALFEIEPYEVITVLAVRHQREEDDH